MRDIECNCPRCTGRDDGLSHTPKDEIGWTEAFPDDFPLDPLCEYCGIDVEQGKGVDHELNENEVIVFCSMDHFKAWIDEHIDYSEIEKIKGYIGRNKNENQ